MACKILGKKACSKVGAEKEKLLPVHLNTTPLAHISALFCGESNATYSLIVQCLDLEQVDGK